MHLVTAKHILSAGNGMNIYRGCQHGCIYCDSRNGCYRMDHPFEDIEVKENAILLLEQALKSKRKPCMIGTGAMSDPYMPLEEQLNMTRQALEIVEKYGFGITFLTKSHRFLRDLPLLQRINSKTKAVVQMTLTTWDPQLCRILEPNVASTQERVAALRVLRDAGIPTVVWLCPIILDACAEAGVKGIINFGMGLTLREENRAYFYGALDRHFPGLKQQYIRTYGNAYVLPSPRQKELNDLFHASCEKYGIWHENEKIFAYLKNFEEKSQQLSFF